MTAQTRAAVWIDHHQARIFHVDLDGFDEQTLRAPSHHFHRHPKGAAEGHAHPQDEKRFLAEVAGVLASAEEILVLGPSIEKTHLLDYFRDHAHALAGKVVAVDERSPDGRADRRARAEPLPHPGAPGALRSVPRRVQRPGVARVAEAVAVHVALLAAVHRARRVEHEGAVVGRVGDAVAVLVGG